MDDAISSRNRGSMEKSSIAARRRKTGALNRRFWMSNVTTNHAELICLAHCFCTGLIDASIFGNYSVFVAMQTGNTVILALSTADLSFGQPYSWLTTLVSLASFLLGALATSHLSYRLIPLRRLTISSNLLLQGLLIAVSAILVTQSSIGIPEDNHGNDASRTLTRIEIVAVIPCLAFQSGAQIATSKLLGIDEIPINVVTSLYAGLMGDKDLFVWSKDGKSTWGWQTGDTKRSRRIAAIACVMGGALCAAWILKLGPGLILSLWLGAGIKIIVAVTAALGMGKGYPDDAEDQIGAELHG